MKAQFETPEIKLLAFLPVDVITTSNGLGYEEAGDNGEVAAPFSIRWSKPV